MNTGHTYDHDTFKVQTRTALLPLPPHLRDIKVELVAHKYGDMLRAELDGILTRSTDPIELTVHTDSVDRVWDAIVVYWLMPLLIWLSNHTSSWRRAGLDRASRWAGTHITTVTDRQTVETSRYCPHLDVHGERTHVDFLTTGAPNAGQLLMPLELGQRLLFAIGDPYAPVAELRDELAPLVGAARRASSGRGTD